VAKGASPLPTRHAGNQRQGEISRLARVGKRGLPTLRLLLSRRRSVETAS
jgi:hypothetical protein